MVPQTQLDHTDRACQLKLVNLSSTQHSQLRESKYGARTQHVLILMVFLALKTFLQILTIEGSIFLCEQHSKFLISMRPYKIMQRKN